MICREINRIFFINHEITYTFESTDFGGGRIINVNGTLSPYYYTTDHLGSVRVITDANGNVVERNDYYPFGKRMTTGNTYPTTSSNRWKYNGKEVQITGGVNWLDYGAREYDEVTGRWTRPDPMSEKHYGTSGYTYCADNPIINIDPDGKRDSIVVKKNKITVRSNYYTGGNAAEESAEKSAQVWTSRVFRYKSQTGKSYSVKFKINIIPTDSPNFAPIKASRDPIGNSYIIGVPKDSKDKDSHGETSGSTTGREDIIVREKYSQNGQTGAHEMGHTLGAGHTNQGIMTKDLTDPNRRSVPSQKTIDEIINDALRKQGLNL